MEFKKGMSRSYFKTSPQAQSLRWIEGANPRNPAVAGLLRLSPLDPP